MEYEFNCGFRNDEKCSLRQIVPFPEVYNPVEVMLKTKCEEKSCPIMENRKLLLRITEMIDLIIID